MKHFLIVFEKPTGKRLRLEIFSDANTALRERFRAERMHRSSPDVEVVVLTAESEEALHRTHGRYFASVSDLATVGSEAVASSRSGSAQAHC